MDQVGKRFGNRIKEDIVEIFYKVQNPIPGFHVFLRVYGNNSWSSVIKWNLRFYFCWYFFIFDYLFDYAQMCYHRCRGGFDGNNEIGERIRNYQRFKGDRIDKIFAQENT